MGLYGRNRSVKKVVLGLMLVLCIMPIDAYSDTGARLKSGLSDEDKLYGLSLFWREASYNFAFFDQVSELDFDKTYREYIPQVLSVGSDYEYYRVLMKLSAQLKDGHTNVFMPKELLEKYLGWPDIDLSEANRKAVVTGVGKENRYLVPLGSIIISVEGVAFESHLKTNVMPYVSSSTDNILWDESVKRALTGLPGTYVRFTIETPSGEYRDVRLKRNSRSGKVDKVYLKMPVSNGELIELKWMGDGIIYISINGFRDEKILDYFQLYFDEIKKSNGVIIDLRHNKGGQTSYAAEILAHFTDRDSEGAIWKTRKHVAAYKAWGRFNEEYKEYASNNAWVTGLTPTLKAKGNNSHIVPTYVLIGRQTASAAEDFLVYADKLSHFTTIGENTFGSTGQPIWFDLPGGGKARVCVKRDFYPDGREFVGFGITPDIPIKRTPEQLRAELDAVLLEAISRLKTELSY